MGHPAVDSVIPGGKSKEETLSNIEMMHVKIPDALWRDLKTEKLLPSEAHTPTGI
jgi:D-threo-aldose 1-dehydrogenase